MSPLTSELQKFQILNPKSGVVECIEYLEMNKMTFLTKYN